MKRAFHVGPRARASHRLGQRRFAATLPANSQLSPPHHHSCALLSSSFPTHLSLACISALSLLHLRPGVADGHSIAPETGVNLPLAQSQARITADSPNRFARPTTAKFRCLTQHRRWPPCSPFSWVSRPSTRRKYQTASCLRDGRSSAPA